LSKKLTDGRQKAAAIFQRTAANLQQTDAENFNFAPKFPPNEKFSGLLKLCTFEKNFNTG